MLDTGNMIYCSKCGAKGVIRQVPEGDNRERNICSSCDSIFYENPRLIVGCLVHNDQQVLLCRRAIEPRYGYWTIPAGFMENGESAEQGALRETLEEAQAQVTLERLFSLYSIIHINQVYLTFLARLEGDDFGAGNESLEVRWFDCEEIPWDEIAFSAVKHALMKWVDEDRGATKTHLEVFNKDESKF